MVIPDRWMNYNAVGTQIEGTPFVAVKVPLRSEVCRNLELEDRFTIEDLVSRIPNLGLVVDLTNTYKYYSPQQLEQYQIRHEKLMTKGHTVPNRNLLIRFIRTTREFHQQNPDKIIGVHCTHGVNRTGYFICSYLILVNNMLPDEALEVFKRSRYEVERKNYVDDLKVIKFDKELLQLLTVPVGNYRQVSKSSEPEVKPFKRLDRSSDRMNDFRDRRSYNRLPEPPESRRHDYSGSARYSANDVHITNFDNALTHLPRERVFESRTFSRRTEAPVDKYKWQSRRSDSRERRPHHRAPEARERRNYDYNQSDRYSDRRAHSSRDKSPVARGQNRNYAPSGSTHRNSNYNPDAEVQKWRSQRPSWKNGANEMYNAEPPSFPSKGGSRSYRSDY